MFKLSRIFFGFVLSVPFYVYGEEVKFGIGATSAHDVITLYAPITRGDLFVEPTLRFSENKSSYQFGNTSYKSTELGVGIFKRSKRGENIYLYGGGRVGRFNAKSRYTDSWGSSYSSKSSGYSIAPSIGAEYEFANNFSVGLELAYVYTKTKSENNGIVVSENTSIAAKKDVIVRYRF